MSQFASQVEFNHPNYTLINGDKVVRNVYSQLTEQEQSEINEEVARYVEARIMHEFGYAKIELPENDDISTTILGSPNWQEANKLLLIIQNKPGSKIGIFSRSICLEQGIMKGSWLPYVERANMEGYGVLILRPNTNFVTVVRDGENVKIPIKGSETPEIHALCVWNNVIPKAENATHIALLGFGGGANICKDLIMKQMINDRANDNDMCDRQISAFVALEASHIIERDDSDDIKELLSNIAINLECNPAPKYYRLDYRREQLGCYSLSLGLPSGSTEVLNVADGVMIALDLVFKYLELSQRGETTASFIREILTENNMDLTTSVIVSNPNNENGSSIPTPDAIAGGGQTGIRRFRRAQTTNNNWSPINIATFRQRSNTTAGRQQSVEMDNINNNNNNNNNASTDNSTSPGRFQLFGRRRSTTSADSNPNNNSKDSPTNSKDNDAEPSETPEVAAKKQKLEVSDFHLLKVVGKGAFGKVLLVKKKSGQNEGKYFAMKILKKSTIIDKGLIEYTKTERTILLEVKHPYIVRLRYAFQNDDKLYLLTDYYNGGNLYCHLRRTNYFTEERAKFYAAEILLALDHLHSLNIIYRDIKLENVLMDHRGHIALTDFGLSEQNIDINGGVATMCGTAEYHPPEIFDSNKKYGHSSDWWSFGILLYEMMAGVTPFYDRSKAVLFRNIISADPIIPGGFSQNAAQCILGLLNKNETKRLGAKGTYEIQQTPFFATIDFELLKLQKIQPPFKPEVTDVSDTKYVPKAFLNTQAADSMDTTNQRRGFLMSLFRPKAPPPVKFDRFTYAGDKLSYIQNSDK